MKLSVEQVTALAPDDASIKAGRGLVNPAAWPALGESSGALWGECQGSGKKPYQVSVDLSGPAFKCTCPSRKFPCKHGLGLMLIAAQKPEALTAGDPPPWVSDWLSSRREKSEKKAAAAAQPKETPPDPEAAAKRAAKRLDRMKQGGEELSRWLADQVRAGIAAYPQHAPSFFAGAAARMVDAQVPGLASEISRLESLVHTGDLWPRRVLAQLGRMHLLAEGLARFESLPAPLQGDLRAYLGWPIDKEELTAAQPRLQDEWCVLGQSFAERERLWERRTWLFGRTTAKAALLLDFAHGNRSFPVLLAAGTSFEASLAFYPAAFPLRAILADPPAEARALEEPFPAHSDLNAAIARHAGALAANPWLHTAPLAVANVVPLRRGEIWLVRDRSGVEVPLRMAAIEAWELLAVSGGEPLAVFGEWSGGELRVLSFWKERFEAFSGGT